MTKAELLSVLAPYPDDTIIVDGRGYELKLSSIDERTIDDWSTATRDADGETPGTAIAISIGPRF